MRPPIALPPFCNGTERAMEVGRDLKRGLPLTDRLKLFSDRLKKQAVELRSGPERDALLMRVRIAHTASDIDRWLGSPGLRPPE